MRSRRALLWLGCLSTSISLNASDFDVATSATNQVGLDLYHQFGGGDNLCLSPYSIQSALAMTFAGADGETRAEMARVLHYPNGADTIYGSFAALQGSLNQSIEKTKAVVEESKKRGGPSEPITLAVANRLFAQTGYDFRSSFEDLVKKYYGAPFESLDFRKNPNEAREHINKWVADQTRDRIRDLVPRNGLNATTRLVLANALYFKAPWANEFSDAFTKPRPFHVHGAAPIDVATMQTVKDFGYAKEDGFTAIGLPYSGRDLQFLIIVPDDMNGLGKLKITNELLTKCAKMTAREMDLQLPKFKFEPPTILLADQLNSLGMTSAFDKPPGSANFDRMAPRKPNDYLAISQVFHKAFIAVDEKGTEAAAATAVAMEAMAAFRPKPKPIEVKIDRPFFYAIQHVPSGACLFIGRVTDPR